MCIDISHSKKAILRVVILTFILAFCHGQTRAQVWVPNELNIKISQDLIKDGHEGDYLSFLAQELAEYLRGSDENTDVTIGKIFQERSPESPLSLWYKIKIVSKKPFDLDHIQKKLLEGFPHIVTVEKEFLTQSKIIPNDPVLGELTYDYYALIGAYEAWDMELGNSSVIVAVIDSGVDVSHSDLTGRFVSSNLFKRYPPESSIDPENPTEECYLYQDQVYCFDIYVDSGELNNGALPPEHDVKDAVPHGTPIAGVIAANHNNVGVPGICPNCKLLPIKVSYLERVVEQTGQIKPYTQGTSTTGKTASAIEYAAQNGADIINISMSTSKKSTVLEDAINDAYEQYNCIIISLADNENEEGKSYPAAYNNVIGVTAVRVNSQNQIVRRENAQYGTWIDVVAPGEKILSLKPDSVNLDAYSGTSLSAPFVSGLAALVRSRYSHFTVHNFRQLLQESAIPIDDPLYFERKLGYGLVHLRRALDGLDDHLWDYDSTTQQGYPAASVDTGGSTPFPMNGFWLNPFATGFSFNPYIGPYGFGYPMNSAFPIFSPFTQGLQQTYYPQSLGFPGGQFTQGFQRPLISSGSVLPLFYGQGMIQPYSNPVFSGQFNQQSLYSPMTFAPFPQFGFGFQQSYPFGSFGTFFPMAGGFTGIPFRMTGFGFSR